MQQFELEGKVYNCPESWKEITLEQLLKINTGITNNLEAICICTGMPYEELTKSTDLILIEKLESTLSFLNDNSGLVLESEPKDIQIGHSYVRVDQLSDLGNLTIGQYQDLKLLILDFHKEEGEEVDIIRRLSLYPKIVAIYLQPFIDKGEYDYNKAGKLTNDLYKHSAVEVSALGYFFIQKFVELRLGILSELQMSVTQQKKVRLGFLIYLRTLVLRLFSTTSLREIWQNRTLF